MSSSWFQSFTVKYLDHDDDTDLTMMAGPKVKFPEFLSRLTDLSYRAALFTNSPIDGQGLTLSDGPWQYRVITEEKDKSEWIMLKTHRDYDGMLAALDDLFPDHSRVVEIQHSSLRPTKIQLETSEDTKFETKEVLFEAVKTRLEAAKKKATPITPSKPSEFAVWEQYRWPPLVVDSGIIEEALQEERLEGINFGKAPKVEAMDIGKASE